jgi:hypothetical protein
MHILLTQTFCLMTQELWLSNNTIGDAGVEALGKACVGGALAQLEWLWLNWNQIGDTGMQALSTALAGGAMAHLRVSSLPNALNRCLKTWHACSPGLIVSFDVPYADAWAREQQYRCCRCNGFGQCLRHGGNGAVAGSLSPHCLIP